MLTAAVAFSSFGRTGVFECVLSAVVVPAVLVQENIKRSGAKHYNQVAAVVGETKYLQQ